MHTPVCHCPEEGPERRTWHGPSSVGQTDSGGRLSTPHQLWDAVTKERICTYKTIINWYDTMLFFPLTCNLWQRSLISLQIFRIPDLKSAYYLAKGGRWKHILCWGLVKVINSAANRITRLQILCSCTICSCLCKYAAIASTIHIMQHLQQLLWFLKDWIALSA